MFALMRAVSSRIFSANVATALCLSLYAGQAQAQAPVTSIASDASATTSEAVKGPSAGVVSGASSSAGAIAPVRVEGSSAPMEPVAQPAPRGKSALERALVAEAKWRASRVAGASKKGVGKGSRVALLEAAKARAELGHDAHAVAYLEAYLDGGHADPEAERLLDRLAPGLVPVEIEVDADPRDSAVTVEVDLYGEPSDVLPPLILQLVIDDGPEGVQRRTVLLTPGKWNVAVPEDGYYDYHEEDIHVVAGTPAEVAIELRADMPAGDRPVFIGLRAASSPFVMGAVGIGLLSGGQVQYRRTLARTESDCSASVYQCSDFLVSAVTLRSTDTALLGASAGVGTALLSGLAPTRRQRAIIWGIESGVGLGALVGGAIGVSFAAGDFNNLTPTTWEDPVYRDAATSAAARHSGAAFVLGYGTSLLVYSAYYLLRDQINAARGTQKRRRDRGRVFALSPSGMAGGGGVMGRF